MGCRASRDLYTISGTDEGVTATAQMLMEAKKIFEQRTGPEIRRMVVVKMPRGRKEIRNELVLLDLVKMGFLSDTDEDNAILNRHLVIYRDSIDECKRLIHYLNGKFGPVASMGRMNPLLKQTQKEKWFSQFSTKGHVAVVQNPEAEYPNEQYAAYERLPADKDTGMPKYRRIDIEARLRYARSQAQGAGAKWRQNHSEFLTQKANGQVAPKNKFGFNQATAIKTDAYAADEEEMNHIAATTAVTGKGVQEVVISGREAMSIQYTDNARKFRNIMQSQGKVSTKLMMSFKREQMRDLIKTKGKVWNNQRRGMWYKRQLDGRVQIADWKQEMDPVILAQPDSIWVKAQAM